MRVPMLVRTAAFGVVAVALAACADAPSAPLAAPRPARVNAPLADALTSTGANSGTFTLNPSKRVTVVFGDHKVTIPANVVCDPSTSGYGPAYWDQDCARLSASITVQVKWGTVNGHTAVSFSPDLRFAPSADQKNWVTLSLKDVQALDGSSAYQIFWQDPATLQWVDEGATDVSLRGSADHGSGKVTRRLKHFSGYTIGANLTDGQFSGTMDGEIVIVQ